MRKLVIVTYVLRGLGFVLVLLSLFGHSLILNVFPGLEGTSINPIFYSGIAVYLVGAVIYFFVNKKENTMALDYFMGELLLKGKVQEFMQYMSWVQQYGGYQYMPRGYQDAVKCIQSQGADKASPYGQYVRKMMGGN